MIDNLLVSRQLMKIRTDNRLTQEVLAKRLKVSRQAVSKWETGISIPDTEMLLELSKLYNVSINDILEPKINYPIKTIEEIVKVDIRKVYNSFNVFDIEDIAKAMTGVSPEVFEFISNIYNDVDFDSKINKIGRVRIEEIESIHQKILSMININLQCDC